MAPQVQEFSLIDLVLADQRDMTAVERFSSFYENAGPVARAYRNLIPLSRPKPGEQYAFVVDLDRCSGCKACVSACHSLNGLEEGEMWRSVGTILGEATPYLQTVTTSCHHCVDPACAAGCPVLAYEKDPSTGIVRHLDDQCIGCQYCVLKCPYDVPKYSKAKGIVRKCDMCSSRLAAAEAPACAQACPHEAIRIDIVNQAAVRTEGAASGSRMIFGAFPSSYTQPTTSYVSARKPPATVKTACSDALQLEPSHWPLVLMTICTQMAAGLHVTGVGLLLGRRVAGGGLAVLAAVCLFLGLTLSVLHLGRPLKAWRAFLGWRRSWMSREILGFSAYAGFVFMLIPFHESTALWLLTALVGLMGVFCSVMIYVDTQRPGWSAAAVFPSFFGDVALLGATMAAAWSVWSAAGPAPLLMVLALGLRVASFAWAGYGRSRARANPASLAHRAASTAYRLASRVLIAQWVLFGASVSFSILSLLGASGLTGGWMAIACACTIASQVLERWLFFAATPAPRMPGAVTV